jgi:hypothetical protein
MNDNSNQKPKPTSLAKILGQSQGVTDASQENLNKPLVDPTGISSEDQAFLNDVLEKAGNGQINLHVPSSLLNEAVYENLDEQKQGKADMSALTILSNVRQIKDLHDLGHTDTYQIQNLVHSCRLMKERVEQECGNCYII